MIAHPHFYLSTAGEYEALAEPRACAIRGRLRDLSRDDYMLVEIDPPLVGQGYGLGGQDINHLLLSTRFSGQTLFPITEWPISVYVTRVLNESILQSLSFTAEDVELVAWGKLFQDREEAEAVAHRY